MVRLTPTDIDAVRDGFRRPSADSRPMMRWWWFGPRVDRAELARELDEMLAAGLGGVEVAVVYPLSETTDLFLSDTFLADLRFAADQARSRGMRFDITLGSGWPFGGPHVRADTAAKRLHWDRQEIGTAAVDVPAPHAWPQDDLIASYLGDGSLQEPPAEFELLPMTGGTIHIPEGRGPRVILTVVSRLTGQNVKRAAAGAEGPVFDHYSATATTHHIAQVCEPLVRAATPELIGSVFCDSLEVYGADWSPKVLDEFRARRGYDPLPLLWLLHVGAARSHRFRADYYRTLTELYEENFVAVMQRWAASRGVPFRIQGYGEPPAGISSYRYADRFEGEGWGWTEIPPVRWAASAAQHYGRSVVSAEIWTWIHSPSFRATPLDLKGEAHEHLLCGVNHFIGHGRPYSPPGADGLGWVFYAAGALDERNPWWPAAVPLFGYLHRLSWLMRQGERVSDIGIYAPTRDVYAAMDPTRGLNLWRGTRDHIGADIPRIVRQEGFDFDLFDDDALQVLGPDRFATIILPCTTDIPEQTAAWLRSCERRGVRVLAVGEAAGAGTVLSSVSDLVDALHAGTAPDVVITPRCPAVGTVHRRIADVDIYLVVNTGPERQRFEFTSRHARSVVEQWDATNGALVGRHPGTEPVSIRLESYEATVLAAFDGALPVAPPASAQRWEDIPIEDWKLHFPGASTTRPVTLPHRWEDTVELRRFSGTATYTTSIHLRRTPREAWLDLGNAVPADTDAAERSGLRGRSFRARVVPPIGDVAEVFVNGARAGVAWSPPYRVALRNLREGDNLVEIRISNTAVAALAADPALRETAEASTRRYGRRFRMQDLDLAMTDVNSGLLAVPRLLLATEHLPG